MGWGIYKRGIFSIPWVWGEQGGLGSLLCLGWCKCKAEEVAGGDQVAEPPLALTFC